MVRLRRSPTFLLLGLLACTLGSSLAAPTAEAGGAFFSSPTGPVDRPRLEREKALIIHDAARGREHFVREFAFRGAERFGIVVPTPSLPEVAKVDIPPFSRLRGSFPFEMPRPSDDDRATGCGSSRGGPVEVVATEKVGSFTAFTLRATDATALAKWLADNELVSTPAADRWFTPYVRMGFYFVALRYDPPEATGSNKYAVAAETIRISFATPVAYYPYSEPEPEHDVIGPRLLELWYVGSVPVVPVARYIDKTQPDAQPRWVRPLQPGIDLSATRLDVEAVLVDGLRSLLPAGKLVVQTFQDQKLRRSGYQDILFAFAAATPLSPAQQEVLTPLLGVLDPTLIWEVR